MAEKKFLFSTRNFVKSIQCDAETFFLLFKHLFFIMHFSLASFPEAYADGENAYTEKSKTITTEPIAIVDTQISQKAAPLPDILENKIYAGKKTTTFTLNETPEVTTNNYRQIFSQIPGLLVSEVGNESFSSVNYRGIGDPHESFNIMFLRDGIPLNVDPYGYPAVYFTPPSESIDSIEFIRGGAGLLYGPQPGGALNYTTFRPSQDLFTFSTKHVFGSKNLYSTFTSASGTSGNTSWLGYFHHRQSDGFRTFNSDYDIYNGYISTLFKTSVDTTVSVDMDIYNSDHGEAGGVTKGIGDGLANYDLNRFQATRQFDRLRIERYVPTVKIQHELSNDASLNLNLWTGFIRRYSKRQSQGDTPSFGGVANGSTNDIVIQEFANLGLDGRYLQNWTLGEQNNAFTIGYLVNGINTPFVQQKGAAPDSEAGVIQRKLDRYTIGTSLYAENLFRINERFSLTPGVRIENIYQNLREKRDLSNTTGLPLREESTNVVVPLFGIGSGYNVTDSLDAYGNISQGYRAKAYQDIMPLAAGDTISDDLDPTDIMTYEAGVRGTPLSWFSFDTSAYLIQFTNQVGRVETEIQNVGNSRHYGIDFSGNIGLFTLAHTLSGAETTPSGFGELSLYGNASLLNAEFIKGPVVNKTPQFAPDYLVRTGLVYTLKYTKIQFLGTFVDNHFADDSNSEERSIPGYKVWDLLTEVPVFNNTATFVAGINNIFDENYYSRVRSTGIEPANPRNWYGGLTLKF
jgi:Fe(3+) dicitrate transport protein